MTAQSSPSTSDEEPATSRLASPAADAEGLKRALRALGGGVSIVTAGEGETRTGATVTSATALSIEPPRMFSLNRSSSTWPVVEQYRNFCINVVGQNHETLVTAVLHGIVTTKGSVDFADLVADDVMSNTPHQFLQ
ncbi:flavin reductase family protein [Mesorhizobium sp. M1403]